MCLGFARPPTRSSQADFILHFVSFFDRHRIMMITLIVVAVFVLGFAIAFNIFLKDVLDI